MTEEEAKTKWCPHVRDADENHGSYNRWKKWVHVTVDGLMRHKQLDELDEGCTCIGSECMAWRKLKGQVPVPADEVGSYKYVNANGGYCGLAGKP